MASVVLPLFVLSAGGSATVVGIITFVCTLVAVASQALAGALVDRLSPARAFRMASTMQAVCWGTLALIVIRHEHPTWPLVGAIGAIAMGFSSLCYPSEGALIKVLVSPEQFGRAAAVSQGREAAAGLLGGPTGGALFGVAAVLGISAQAAMHAIAALLVPSPDERTVGAAGSKHAGQGYLSDVIDGFHASLQHYHLRSITVVAALMNLPMAALPLTLILYFQSRGFSAGLIGMMSACVGVGVLGGSFISGALTGRYTVGSLGVMALGGYVTTVLLVVILHESFVWTCVSLVASGFLLPAFNSAISAYTITVTPPERVGRVTSAIAVPGMALMPLGPLLAGVLFDQAGVRLTLAVVWLLALGPFLVAAVSPGFRTTPGLAALTEGTSCAVTAPERTAND